MIHLAGPYLLAALLAGLGAYGVLARRNAVLVLIGVELILNAATLLLVSVASAGADRWAAGNVLTLFVITIAAAEVVVALAVVLAVYRLRGDVDLADSLPGDAGTGMPPKGTVDDRATSEVIR
ncbi:NADH-quinone oxidoreductase subunit K [Phycicoccus badiiscoriae]|uniref:NADH-quinone oxidoreductase subunit K n=1 Tax=Pedococcus badiiscoriae TaxID=642776 RepID=A0A852WCK0_9MICO|nr:NADH-quinone oxidoreductase subunit NuoK [Pedococcus badiiscoriae]NYG06410.1 NADH-quinone oxidoreductase subunit K [Pedococcus badiiscoriae]